MASIRFSGQPFDSASSIKGSSLRLIAHHAGHHVAEERRLGRQIFVALDLAAEPVAFEFGEDVVDAGAADVHLIQRLHRREPRRAAPVGFFVGAFRLPVLVAPDAVMVRPAPAGA